jgi:hypothetical protein
MASTRQKVWRSGIALLLALVIIATFFPGCGGGGEEEVTITIGEITDFTGVSAPATVPMHQSMVDLVRYYNDQGLIPGAKLRLVSYDTRTDAARFTVGYDWCKERGADITFTPVTGLAETIRPFAERDKIPVANPSYSEAAVEPPGWVFAFCAPFKAQVKTLLNWISEQWDYTERIPKLGHYTWNLPMGLEVKAGIEEYCQDNPDKFDYVGTVAAPLGSTSAAGEAEKLRGCDYVFGTGFMSSVIMKAFSAKGYHTQFIGDGTSFGFYNYIVNSVGWENLDGYIITMTASSFDEENAAVAFIKEVISRYHPGKSPEDIGGAYHGAFLLMYSMFEILRQAVEKVGVENFDGQAFCDAAVKYSLQIEGFPQCYFTDTVRYLVHQCAIYKWSAEVHGLVRLTDWLPLAEE